MYVVWNLTLDFFFGSHKRVKRSMTLPGGICVSKNNTTNLDYTKRRCFAETGCLFTVNVRQGAYQRKEARYKLTYLQVIKKNFERF